MASRKIAQWPPTLGIGIEFHALDDPALVSRGAAVASAILGRGIFEVEFIRDPRDGGWVAIDLNPRAHGFIRLDIDTYDVFDVHHFRELGRQVDQLPTLLESR